MQAKSEYPAIPFEKAEFTEEGLLIASSLFDDEIPHADKRILEALAPEMNAMKEIKKAMHNKMSKLADEGVPMPLCSTNEQMFWFYVKGVGWCYLC